MEQYIPKSALVTEIEKLKKIQLSIFSKGESIGRCYDSLTCISVYNEILSFINTLEVKEIGVDLGDPKGDKSAKCIIDTKTLEVKEVNYKPIDNDFERDAVNFCFDNGLNTTPRIAKTIAKHFFELGISVSNKAQKGEKV